MEGAEQLKQITTYTFKYNSDNDSIDLNTLLLSQIHFSTILNEIKNKIAGETNLSIRIRPLQKGSVPFDILLDVSWLRHLLSPEVVAYASGIVGTFVGLIQLKIWLKGKKPDKIEIKDDKVLIKIGDVEVVVDRNTYQIYEKNATVDIAFKKAFEAIENDESVTGIEVVDDNKQSLVEVPRAEFEDFTAPNAMFEDVTEVEPTRKETLIVLKAVFDKGYKWQFYMNGRKINASIKDDAFMSRVKAGEKFGSGDTLIVEMEVTRVLDKNLNVFVEKEFIITNVIEHVSKPEGKPGSSGSLFDN